MNVIESIYKEPEKWRQGTHTFRHKDGATVWTCNVPIFDTNMHPAIKMSIVQRFKLWRAVRWWANNAPIDAFNNQ